MRFRARLTFLTILLLQHHMSDRIQSWFVIIDDFYCKCFHDSQFQITTLKSTSSQNPLLYHFWTFDKNQLCIFSWLCFNNSDNRGQRTQSYNYLELNWFLKYKLSLSATSQQMAVNEYGKHCNKHQCKRPWHLLRAVWKG